MNKLSVRDADPPSLPWEIIDEILILTKDVFLTIKLCRFEIVKKMISKRPCCWALENGQVTYLHYLYLRGDVKIDKDFRVSLKIAIMRNYLNIIKYCHTKVKGITGWYLIDYAASVGNLNAVKYLHSIGSSASHRAMDSAAQNGHLEILQWLNTNRKEGCSREAMDSAALNGHVEVLRWLHNNRNEGCSTKAMYCAVLYGHLDVVKFLFEVGIDEVCSDSVRMARRNGQMEVVEYLDSITGIAI